MDDRSSLAGLVANQYRQAIQSAYARSRADIEALHCLLDAAQRAFDAGAWQGGSSNRRYGVLIDLRQQAHSMALQAASEFDRVARTQADLVPADSWQARWFW